MHKWLQLPATPTDDPLATVYPINQYKKSHVYAVTRINPIYVDDEHHGTWNKSGSSGYDSQPHSDHSSLDKRSPPAKKCARNEKTTGPALTTPAPTSPTLSSPSDRSSGSLQRNAVSPWLSPIKEGVIDVHQFCIPRPVWPGRDGALMYPAGPEHIPRAKCCRHCVRCRCHSDSSSSSTRSNGKITAGGGSYSGYSSAYGELGGGTISTSSTSTASGSGSGDGGRGSGGDGNGSCSDDAIPSSGTASVKSHQSPLVLDPRFGDVGGVGVNKGSLVNDWNSIDMTLNQKTDNLHYDCGAMLRGLQFTLDAQQAEKLMQKIKVGKKHRCWCRFVTALLGLIMFLVSVITVSLTLTRGQKMFGSL